MSAESPQVVYTSKVETWLLANVMKPALEYVPESVHPNTLSLINHVLCWVVFIIAVLSRDAEPGRRVWMLLVGGVVMFATMMLDCLDGMQARRTNRCSKLGEMMDHWLDAVHVPLVSGGCIMALQVDPWALVLVHVTAAMTYAAQLVLYHHKGKFVYPPTSGTEAQLGWSIGYAMIGVWFFFFPRETPWVSWAVAALCLGAIVIQLRVVKFYADRLGKLALEHVPFVLSCMAFGVLYWMQAMDALAFTMVVVFVSFRITGSYVLYTIVGKRFSGFDAGIPVWAAAIALVHFALPKTGMPYSAYTLEQALPWLACLYLAGRNLADFVKHFDALRPAERVRTA